MMAKGTNLLEPIFFSDSYWFQSVHAHRCDNKVVGNLMADFTFFQAASFVQITI